MIRPRARGLATLLSLVALAATARVAAASCVDDPLYRSLDPWLGEWRIVELADGAQREIGRTVVRAVVGGCAIEETRRLADGSEQRALAVLDAASRTWRHSWVDSDGDRGLLEVTPAGDTLRVAGTIHLRGTGQELALRSLVTPRHDGGFDERSEISTDGGRTFELQPATAYLRVVATAAGGAPQSDRARAARPAPMPPEDAVPAAAPAPTAPADTAAEAAPTTMQPAQSTAAAEPAPRVEAVAAAEPAAPADEAPAVRLFSRRKAEPGVRDTAVESPMTVEFELGPLAALPAGSSWRTRELAPYVVENVSIPMVTAGREEKRGKVIVELIVNILTRSKGAKVDLEATLLAEGAAVASARGENIALGRLIGSHDPEVGRPYPLELELDAATFAELFAGDRRPTLRLTLGVR